MGFFKQRQMFITEAEVKGQLGFLTALYFVFEVAINFAVYDQMTGNGNYYALSSMERWGKIIAGLGMALLISRAITLNSTLNSFVYKLVLQATKKKVNYWKCNVYSTFLALCLITIPLSFYIQDKIVEYVVESSTPEDRNKAVIAMAAHNTIAPFLAKMERLERPTLANFESNNPQANEKNEVKTNVVKNTKGDVNLIRDLAYPFLPVKIAMPKLYYTNHYYGQLTERCVHIGESKLGVKTDMGKIFFPYLSIKNGFDEKLYADAIKENLVCLFEDDRYFRYATRNRFEFSSALYELHKQYVSASKKHYHAKKYNKKEADKRWREAMNDAYGFKTTIEPSQGGYLPSYTFNHPDTIRLYEEKTGFVNLHPSNKHFKERTTRYLLTHANEFLLPGYIPEEKQNIDTPIDPKMVKLIGPRNEISEKQRQEVQNNAYKAVIIPLVVIGASSFFLVLNSLLLLHSLVIAFIPSAKRKVPSRILLAVLILWFALWPAYKTPPIVDAKNIGYAAKWAFYHESNISKLYKPKELLKKIHLKPKEL